MTKRGRYEWISDGVEVSMIFVIFGLVYAAIGVGGIWTLVRSGGRLVRTPTK
jgi:hypothetical protein